MHGQQNQQNRWFGTRVSSELGEIMTLNDSNYFPIDVFFYMPFFKKGHHKITLAEEHQIGRDLFASNSQVPPLPTSPCCRKLSPPNPPDIWGAAIDFPAPRPQEMIPSSPSTSAPTRRPPNSAHWRGELESPQAPPAPQSPNFTAIFWGSFWVWGLVVVYFFTFPIFGCFFFRGGPITTWTWVI